MLSAVTCRTDYIIYPIGQSSYFEIAIISTSFRNSRYTFN
uniref:Uncharacterized protein n=1 Tax=Siphoviridae sp. ctnPP24 TaxID=2825662 RepID=A0A8S5TZ11_9CAUD|nr:MAG TPA: hypothetical protein [Siphoviridae sp. ctnPP24]